MHMEILSRFKNTYEVNMKDWKSSGNLISFNEIHCIKTEWRPGGINSFTLVVVIYDFQS